MVERDVEGKVYKLMEGAGQEGPDEVLKLLFCAFD